MTVPERLMIVSWGLPPSINGSGMIVENLSHEFTPDEMILVGQAWVGTEKYHRDPALPRIYHVNREPTWPRRGQRYTRWMRWLTLPRVVRRLSQIARDENVIAIIGVFPDEFFLCAAYKTAERLGLPFYPYMHNTYLENRQGMKLRFAKWLEPRAFRAARVVFAMSDAMRAHYEALYPHMRFEAIVHSFHEPIPAYEPPPTPGENLRLAFLGNLNDSNLDATRRLVEVVNRRPDYHLTTYSGSPDWFFAKMGISGPRIKHTSVPYDQVTPALRGYDILLLPHGFTGGLSKVEYDTIFPTRTLPNLLSGRPIVAHTPRNCAFTEWLRKHDCAEIVDVADADEVERAIERLRHDAARRAQLARNGLEIVKMFYAPVVAGKLRDLIAETAPQAAGCVRHGAAAHERANGATSADTEKSTTD